MGAMLASPWFVPVWVAVVTGAWQLVQTVAEHLLIRRKERRKIAAATIEALNGEAERVVRRETWRGRDVGR